METYYEILRKIWDGVSGIFGQIGGEVYLVDRSHARHKKASVRLNFQTNTTLVAALVPVTTMPGG